MCAPCCLIFFFFQAEDGIRDAQESRGLGDVYKRQCASIAALLSLFAFGIFPNFVLASNNPEYSLNIYNCLLYTSDAADDLLCVDLGGRRIIKKKKPHNHINHLHLKRKT